MTSFEEQANQQGVRSLIEPIHGQPALGQRNAVVHCARGEQILPQLVVRCNDLAADLFASYCHPVFKLGSVGQVEIGEEVALVGGKRGLEATGFGG